MTKHDFSDLTPPQALVNDWCQQAGSVFGCCSFAARWGAEQAAERLAGQWPTPITDRPPEEKDADEGGFVQSTADHGMWCCYSWAFVRDKGWSWLHTPRWQPPAPPSLKEQAMKLLEPEGTPARVLNEDQLSLIRRALETNS